MSVAVTESVMPTQRNAFAPALEGVAEEAMAMDVEPDLRKRKLSLCLKWIDLAHNRGITNAGVDVLNQIYVRNLKPTPGFVVCVDGCAYEPNPSWDLALL